MQKIKKGDQVVVVAGKDKGKNGDILRVVNSKNGRKRVYVSGANMVTKHVRPNPNAGQPGGRIEKEASLDISNVAIFNATTGKRDRVGFRHLEDGRKVRFYKSNNELIDA